MRKLTPFLIAACLFATAQSANDIRAVRLASNQAIAAQDLEAIAETWTDDIQVTISSGKHLSGKAAYKAAFQSVFKSMPGVSFVRSPQQITIADNGVIACEWGRWTGRYPDQAITSRNGEYMAYWRLEDGKWRISAELFVPLQENQ